MSVEGVTKNELEIIEGFHKPHASNNTITSNYTKYNEACYM